MKLVCAAVVIENTDNNGVDILGRLADLLDWGQRLFFIIPIIVLVVLFMATFLSFRKQCKKITQEQVRKYTSTGKYIKGLFVELNNSKEYIRAFCFNKLWKQKVIRNYNALFNDKMGKELPNVYSESAIKLKLSKNSCVSEIKNEIEKMRTFLDRVNKRQLVCNPEYKNTDMRYECFGSGYSKSIEEIGKMASYLDSNCMVITGTAGNGKSMMLCSVADLLSNNKETVVFLNARDIKENLISYMTKILFNEKLKSAFGFWWSLQGFVHSLMRKNIYIIVDAINENDSMDFLETLSDSVEKLLKPSRVRIIMSCRSEYYDYRYRKYIINEGSKRRVSSLDLQEGEYSYEAKERLIANYAQHYKFDGELSEDVKNKITGQLLLARIFFEVYSGKNDNIYELNKYELYKRYIDGTNNRELSNLLEQLTKHMFENHQYENIPLSSLCQSPEKYEMIDSSILVCRDLIKNQGNLREETVEVINFVYDEMRDYLLSKYLLGICEDAVGNIDYSEVMSALLTLKEQKAICLEGIINYLFCFCLSENNTKMLEFLLFNLIKLRDDQIDEFRNRRNSQISSWGLNLLFETDSIDSDFGKKYVDYILKNNPGKEGQKLLFYLLRQEYMNGKSTLNIILDAFLRVSTVSDFEKKIGNTIASWKGEGVTVSDLVRIHEKLAQTNRDGADRFLVYAYLIVKCYDWNGKNETEKYIKTNCKREMINDYISRVRECIH